METIIVPWRLLSHRDHDFYSELIKRSGKRLKALTIRVKQFAWHEHGGLHAGGCTELAQRLFEHGKGEHDQTPLQLRDINFQNQNLGSFDATWRHYIDMTKLRTIQIWNCYRVDFMLQSLIDLTKSHTLRLEGLVLSFEDTRDSPTLVETFLRSFTGLCYLNLCFVPENCIPGRKARPITFDIRCLAHHCRTMQDLYIGVGTNIPPGSLHTSLWMPKMTDVQWLVSECRNLKQLAIAMPKLEVDHALSGEWGQYLTYIVCSHIIQALSVTDVAAATARSAAALKSAPFVDLAGRSQHEES